MSTNTDPFSVQNTSMYSLKKKSTRIVYLLWFFLGFLGAHYLYLGNVRKGALYVSLLLVVGTYFLGTYYGPLGTEKSAEANASANFFLVVSSMSGLALLILWVIDAFTLSKRQIKKNKKLT